MFKKNRTIRKAAVSAGKNKELDNNDPWENQEIQLVDDIENCREVVKQLQSHCDEYNVLGIGCDIANYNSQKILLLQLATHRGLCALIRLYSLKTIPTELRNILEDKNIIKVDVDTSDIAVKLTDYGVRTESILDLRYLAQKYNVRNHQSIRLGDLSKEYLKINLGETYRLKRENWKKKRSHINARDIEYAGKTVRVAIELFKYFENEFNLKNPCDTPFANGLQLFIEEKCKPHLNHICRYETKEEDQKQETDVADQPKVQENIENELFPIQEVHLISNVEECQDIVEQFRKHCNEDKVLSFDCEISQRTISLLQLASYRGLCIILQLRKLKTIPTVFHEILEDKNILKFGDRVLLIVERLEADYGVRVTSERNIQSLVHKSGYKSSNVHRLSKMYLNIDIQTLDWRLLHTDWRSETVSLEAINHAAKSVYATIELFKFFEKILMEKDYSGDRTKFIEDLYAFQSKKDRETNEDSKCTLPDQDIHIVNNAEEYQAVAEQIRMHCDEYNVLGFDCEWKSPFGRKIALLQLATHRGLCILIRLCKMTTIPTELKTILEDEKILKVGIIPHIDAKKLSRDFHIKVSGTFDLKHLAMKCKCRASGIGKLSEEVLKVKLNYKTKGLITDKMHKKWENETLDDENIKYAANDAHAAIELFKKFQEKLMPNQLDVDQTKCVQQFIDEHCMIKKVKK